MIKFNGGAHLSSLHFILPALVFCENVFNLNSTLLLFGFNQFYISVSYAAAISQKRKNFIINEPQHFRNCTQRILQDNLIEKSLFMLYKKAIYICLLERAQFLLKSVKSSTIPLCAIQNTISLQITSTRPMQVVGQKIPQRSLQHKNKNRDLFCEAVASISDKQPQ